MATPIKIPQNVSQRQTPAFLEGIKPVTEQQPIQEPVTRQPFDLMARLEDTQKEMELQTSDIEQPEAESPTSFLIQPDMPVDPTASALDEIYGTEEPQIDEQLVREFINQSKAAGKTKQEVKDAINKGMEQGKFLIQPEVTQEPKSTPQEDISGLDVGVKFGQGLREGAEKYKFQADVDDGVVESGLKFIGNLPADTAQLAGDVITVASDPVGTTKSILDLGQGIADKLVFSTLNSIFGTDVPDTEKAVVVDSITDEVKRLANNPQELKVMLVENPADVLTAVTGGLNLAKNTAKSKNLTGLANKLEQAEKITNPLNIQAQAVKKTGQAAKGLAETASRIYTKTTGVDFDSVKSIVKNPELFKQAETGALTRSSLGDATVKAIDSRIDDLSELGKEYGKLRKGKVVATGDELSDIKTKVVDKVDTRELTTADSRSVNEAVGYIDRYAGDVTDGNLLSLRKQIDSVLYDPNTGLKRKLSPQGERVVQGLRGQIDSMAKDRVEGLSKLDKKFAPEITELRKVKSLIYDSRGNIKDNYIQQIANLTGKGKELKLERLKKIIPDIDKKINALKALEDVELAKGTKVGTYQGAITAGVGLAGGIVPAIATYILTHPSTLVKILKAYTGAKTGVSNIANKVKNGIKLSKDEAKIVGDAIKAQAKDVGVDLSDKAADAVGARAKFLDDTGKRLDDFSLDTQTGIGRIEDFDNVDEFVSANTVFHGGDKSFINKLKKDKEFNPLADRDAGTGGNRYGLSTTTDRAVAKDFSTSSTGNPAVTELYISPDAKVYNLKKKTLDDLTEAETKNIADDFDVIIDVDNVGGEKEIRILNDGVLRDKSQLASYYSLYK